MEGGFCNAKTKSVCFLTTQQSGRCYDASHLLVLEFRIIGRGHSAADKLASVLNLHKPVNKSPWLSHTKPLTEKAEGPGN